MKMWTEIDVDITSSSLFGLKNLLKQMLKSQNVQPNYLIDDQNQHIHHVRIRNKCSDLNAFIQQSFT